MIHRTSQSQQGGELSVGFAHHAAHLVAHAQIQREIGTDPPVILNISAKQLIAQIAWSRQTWKCGPKAGWLIRKERIERPERVFPGHIGVVLDTGLHVLEVSAQLQRMSALSKGDIVVEDEEAFEEFFQRERTPAAVRAILPPSNPAHLT
jgi:hypothetical protein